MMRLRISSDTSVVKIVESGLCVELRETLALCEIRSWKSRPLIVVPVLERAGLDAREDTTLEVRERAGRGGTVSSNDCVCGLD